LNWEIETLYISLSVDSPLRVGAVNFTYLFSAHTLKPGDAKPTDFKPPITITITTYYLTGQTAGWFGQAVWSDGPNTEHGLERWHRTAQPSRALAVEGEKN